MMMEETPPSLRKVVTHAEALPAYDIHAGFTPARGVKFVQIRSAKTGEALVSIANERAVELARAILRAYAHNTESHEITEPLAEVLADVLADR